MYNAKKKHNKTMTSSRETGMVFGLWGNRRL